MDRDQKAAVVEEIAGQLSAADAVFAVDYRGLTVTQAAELRAKLKDAGAAFRVVKNSLTERAAERAGAELLKPMLEGPTALALVEGDPALAAKALNDTARTLRLLEFKGGLLNGDALSAEDVRSIARLPAREVLHGQLVGVIAAPLSGLARTLNALVAGVAVQLQQIAEQGLIGSGEAAGSPAPSEEVGAEGRATSATEAEAPAGEAEAPAAEGPAAAPATEGSAVEADAAQGSGEEAPAEDQSETETQSESESDETPVESGE